MTIEFFIGLACGVLYTVLGAYAILQIGVNVVGEEGDKPMLMSPFTPWVFLAGLALLLWPMLLVVGGAYLAYAFFQDKTAKSQ